MLSEMLMNLIKCIQTDLDNDLKMRPAYVTTNSLLLSCGDSCTGSCSDTCGGSCEGDCEGGCSYGCVSEGEGFCDFTR